MNRFEKRYTKNTYDQLSEMDKNRLNLINKSSFTKRIKTSQTSKPISKEKLSVFETEYNKFIQNMLKESETTKNIDTESTPTIVDEDNSNELPIESNKKRRKTKVKEENTNLNFEDLL